MMASNIGHSKKISGWRSLDNIGTVLDKSRRSQKGFWDHQGFIRWTANKPSVSWWAESQQCLRLGLLNPHPSHWRLNPITVFLQGTFFIGTSVHLSSLKWAPLITWQSWTVMQMRCKVEYHPPSLSSECIFLRCVLQCADSTCPSLFLRGSFYNGTAVKLRGPGVSDINYYLPQAQILSGVRSV